MQLRDYQIDAKNQIRAHYRNGKKKVLLHLATGAGKTVVFTSLLNDVYNNGKHAIMVVRGRMLVENAHIRLKQYGVPHGVMMAGHKHRFPSERIQVCSVDTLYSRKIAPKADAVILDEGHMCCNDSYHWLADQYPNAYFLPVTATPYLKKPLTHIAEVVVCPITMDELITEGFLVPIRYFAPASPDLSKVKISAGEYHQTQLYNAMDKPHLTADIITTWKNFGENRPTICFAVNIKHSKSIMESFNQAGIPAKHCEANTPDSERAELIDELRTGKIKILSNVGILTTGVDMPHVACIIMARPTKSLNLHIQMVGRGPRPYDNKYDCLLLDHANNTSEHGFINELHEVNLLGIKKRSKKPVQIKICKNCFACYTGIKCNECGEKSPPETRILATVAGELVEIEADEVSARFRELKIVQKDKGYKRGWLYYRMKDEFGQDVADRYVKKREVPSWIKNKLSGVRI